MPRAFEDFRIGDVYELGSQKVTQEEIVRFARMYDPQPRHLDDEDLIASGWHVTAMFMRLYADEVLRHAEAEVSPGVDELRWLRPVRPGDVLTGRVTVVGVAASLSRPDCGVLQQRGEFLDEENLPVMRVMLYGLMRKRGG
ncbi:MaoC/PaaZ C-terminal domain-containing protein [Streptosporangium carneum]|uniref:Enoyl-CoA hydratase n=1 Tax=Streptosporangium carneum TaxID=47481 RepID=A0A9W6MD31_9ACTN|nr:MaoC/PaaZ C-terminal domain-containing protein [Streptosporangium carneum]GLK09490.1 enoyl-CoA hydratase [Streptosporangium carneum]